MSRYFWKIITDVSCNTINASPKKYICYLPCTTKQTCKSSQLQAKKKSDIVLTYNKTKVGVDAVDSMTKHYSWKAPTRRWPVAVFYNIIDMSIINSCVLFRKVNRLKISRRDFIIQLIEEIRVLNEI